MKCLTMLTIELCAAVIVAKLLRHTARILDIPNNLVYAWSDSSIELRRLRGNHQRFKLFVSPLSLFLGISLVISVSPSFHLCVCNSFSLLSLAFLLSLSVSVLVSLSLLISLSLCLSVFVSISSFLALCLSLCSSLCVYLFFSLSLSLSVSQSVSLSAFLSL